MSNYCIVLISKSKSSFYNLLKIGNFADVKLIDNITNINYKMQIKAKQKKINKNKEKIGKVKSDNDEEYISKITSILEEDFINNKDYNTNGIILAGPNNIKKKIKNHSNISKYLDKISIDLLNTSTINENTIWQVHDNYFIKSQEEEKTIIDLITKLEIMIENCDNKLTFGKKEIIDGLNDYMISTILISNLVNYEIKKEINELNKYDCKIFVTHNDNMKKLGVDIIGIKFF